MASARATSRVFATSYVVLLVALLLLSTSGLRVLGVQCGYSSKCRNIKLGLGDDLEAECKDANGVYRKTSLRLDEGLRNNNGVASCQAGAQGFLSTCVVSRLAANGHTLQGACLNSKQKSVYYTLDLDQCVGVNDQGQLALCLS